MTGPVFFPAHCADSESEDKEDEVEDKPALGIARDIEDEHEVQAPIVTDIPIPEVPVRWVHACAARRKRHGRRLMANGSAETCPTCSAVPDATDDSTADTDQPTTTRNDDVVVDHVVQLPCHASSATHKPTAGQKFRLDECDVQAITKMVKDIAWPSNARRVVNGRGECLGATNDANGARLGKNTTRREAFCKRFNHALAAAIGDSFQWGSLQVNVNSVSEEHRDANNTGLSTIVLLGEFTGGRFAMSDQSHSLTADERGTALVIDGTRLHYSEPFKGFRVSIVAFLHKATADLPSSQLEYLRSLGFKIPADKALPEPCSHISHEAEGLPCLRCGAFWSDSGAYRLPGYGGEWDEHGPIRQIGAHSARGLTPGPSCLHTWGHPRYEGTLSVKFAPRVEWFYDPPCYGELGRPYGPRRSRKKESYSKERESEILEAKKGDPYDIARCITEAFSLQGLHGCPRAVGWPVCWTHDLCYIGLPPCGNIVGDNYVGNKQDSFQKEGREETITLLSCRLHEFYHIGEVPNMEERAALQNRIPAQDVG